MSSLEARDAALLAATAAADKKGSDIVIVEVGPVLVITEYFVIVTGSNDRQVKAIVDEVERRLKEAGLSAIGREGEQQATWVLLDFGEIVVHVFQPAERDFYRLERLWSDAPRVPLPDDFAQSSENVGRSAAEEPVVS
ncbi:ribosome silencing factor [Coriobacteriia bacterium Es71-Z0120]|uniref:ribosome silencing factor n=1 Tax=Parvivirga hydrogeniphila TaxID=2939460 RepID=UPI0022610497|nr:ribosome silencing factor [Parvivirga hydrogeniphila]MCL4078979.1 ribosome silencing factor [Parvivirga hydrogeniphila]